MDIAEAGGLSKDGSPRPSKSQQGHMEQPGAMRQVGLDSTVTHSRSKQTNSDSVMMLPCSQVPIVASLTGVQLGARR